MNILEFTKKFDREKGPIYINPEMVICVEEDKRNGGTTIKLMDGHHCQVSEEINDVLWDLRGEDNGDEGS